MTVSKSTLGVLVGEGGPGLQEQAWLAHARSEAWPGPGAPTLTLSYSASSKPTWQGLI